MPKFFKDFIFTLPFFLLSLALAILLSTLHPYFKLSSKNISVTPTPIPTRIPTLPVSFQKYTDILHKITFEYPTGWKFNQNQSQPEYYFLESENLNQVRFYFEIDSSKTIADYLVKKDKISATAWEGQPSVQVNSTQKAKINNYSVIIREEYLLAADIITTITYFKIGKYFVSITYLAPPGNDGKPDYPIYQQILNSIQTTTSLL